MIDAIPNLVEELVPEALDARIAAKVRVGQRKHERQSMDQAVLGTCFHFIRKSRLWKFE